jgi:EAL domain-containing protein (putative c-di-GMP-specific phosphodiesterase class I)
MRAFFKSPLCVTLALVLLGVFTQTLDAFDHVYWNVWFKNRAHAGAANVLIVSLDNGAPLNPAAIGASTARQAALIDRLDAAGSGAIFLDAPQTAGADAAGDAALKAALSRAGRRATLVLRSHVSPALKRSLPQVLRSHVSPALMRSVPQAMRFRGPAETPIAISAWDVNFLGYAERTDAGFAQGKAVIPAVAAVADRTQRGRHLYPDLRFDPRSVPVVDARAVLQGKVADRVIAGRQIFVTSTSTDNDMVLRYYGIGEVPAALVDIAGLQARGQGRAIELGWVPLLAMFAIAMVIGRDARGYRAKLAIYGGMVGLIAILPGVLRENALIIGVGPTLAAMLLYAPLRSLQKWRNRVQLTSSASGLPNIAAMAAAGITGAQDVVAVTISQYEQILATLPRELHGECARQIARRLALGAGDRPVFDNDNGYFVWLEETRTLDTLVEHLDGLRALFSVPLVIAGHVLDTTLHFGIDRNGDAKALCRIQSALGSANEAHAKGKLYEEFGEQRLAESPWELSLHARIDEGLRNGNIWLALQPQYDFRTHRISGAEALIRWTDPDRGAIPPDAFILQAERAGRIEAITYWVLEQSIEMLAQINRVSAPFQISVNLSARMVDHPALVHRIADIVRASGLENCGLITFEVTETFSMANREQAKHNLAALRSMGFRLSIDDFGTGQAGLAYLAEIPSDEIKLDRRFIQPLTTDQRERLIVESVIGLAHAMGQVVVAEGIEDIVTLEALRRMGCDLAQGFHIGRPMRLADLIDVIAPRRGMAGQLERKII